MKSSQYRRIKSISLSTLIISLQLLIASVSTCCARDCKKVTVMSWYMYSVYTVYIVYIVHTCIDSCTYIIYKQNTNLNSHDNWTFLQTHASLNYKNYNIKEATYAIDIPGETLNFWILSSCEMEIILQIFHSPLIPLYLLIFSHCTK